MNNITITGRLTADPELKTTPNGINVTQFSVAVDRAYKSGGEKQTDFFRVVAWRSTAEFICRSIRGLPRHLTWLRAYRTSFDTIVSPTEW